MKRIDKNGPKRELAAIMFADITGYTALMGKDEELALKVLDSMRKIVKPLGKHHGGEHLKEMGDGVLAKFPSAYACSLCAIDIQSRINAHHNFKMRIGIHLGDVVYANGDVFGDGVNIASRIEAQASRRHDRILKTNICLSISKDFVSGYLYP